MTTQSKPRRGGRRRANGEGSIYQRGDGRWAAQVTLPDGKRRAFYGHSHAEVRDKLRHAQATLSQGVDLPDERLTLAAHLDRWLEESVKPSVRQRTAQRYADLARVHIVPALGRVPLARLTPLAVQKFLNEKLAAGLSPRTVQYMRVTLVRALGQAERWGLVPRNVARLVPGPHVPHRDVPALSPEQARALLAALRDDAYFPLYYLALASGLRQGELLGLRWEDVGLDRLHLRVRQTRTRQGTTADFAEPKMQRSRRQLSLDADTAAVLRAHRARQNEQRLALGPAWEDSGLVFTSARGGALDGRGVTQPFQRQLARAGLPPMRFHDLRHGAASLLLSQGISPRVVVERLGHSQIGVTMSTYAHVIPALDRDAAQLVGGLLAGTGGS